MESRSDLVGAQNYTTDRQLIEYLRREYAIATDLIGMGGEEDRFRGRDIYQSIFTEDANIRVVSNGQITHQAIGPGNWFLQVQQALRPYAGVQHLIGSQVVEFIRGDTTSQHVTEAIMSSYLQAWHDCPGDYVFTFIGTYHDRVRLVPGVGWKIHDMELREVSNARFSH